MRNDLMTKEVAKRLEKYPLYSQDGKEEKEVVVRYFNPYGLAQWEVVEAERKENGDYEFFGFVSINGINKEWGYFLLSQIAQCWVNIHGIHLPMERDVHNFGYFINMKGNRILK